MGNNQDKIASYIRGEYSASKKKEFESLLQIDKSLKTDLELTKMITKSLGDRSYVYDKMAQWENELHTNFPDRIKVSKFRKLIIIGGGLAASLVIGVFALQLFNNTTIQNTGDNYAFSIPSFSSSDYMAEDYFIYTEKIDSLINISEYEEALNLIALVEPDFENTLSNDKLGEGLEKAGIENDESEGIIAKYKNDEYILKWRKINLLLVLGKKDEAFNILEEFKDKEGKFKDDATKLYDELKTYNINKP